MRQRNKQTERHSERKIGKISVPYHKYNFLIGEDGMNLKALKVKDGLKTKRDIYRMLYF